MRRKIFSIVVIILYISLGGCVGGGSNSGNTNNGIIYSPKNGTSVPYKSITIAIDANDMESVNIENITHPKKGGYRGLKSSNKFLVHSLELGEGENDLKVTAIKKDGNVVTQNLSIFSTAQVIPVQFKASQWQGFERLNTNLTVDSKVSEIKTYSYDFDGDGVVNIDSQDPNAVFTYTNIGSYFPTIMVETANGILFSSKSDVALIVREKPTSSSIPSLSTLSIIDFFPIAGNKTYALTSDSRLLKIDMGSDQIELEFSLFGLNSPSGFCMDSSNNVYVTDQGSDRVFKYLENSNYSPDTLISGDGSFGGTGSENGEFSQPSDCMVDSTQDNEKIFIVDKGNNRIQVFNRAGIYASQFDGSNTNIGAFNNPESILGSSLVPIVSDTGNNLLRIFSQQGVEKRSFGADIFNGQQKITASDNGILVADTNNNRLITVTSFGEIVDFISTLNKPKVAINSLNSKDTYYVASVGSLGADKYQAEIDTNDSSPEAIAEKYVDAIISNDLQALYRLSSTDGVVDKIYANTDKLNELLDQLNHTNDYSLDAKDHNFAGVSIGFDNTNEIIPITFIRVNNLWLVKRF